MRVFSVNTGTLVKYIVTVFYVDFARRSDFPFKNRSVKLMRKSGGREEIVILDFFF